MHISEDIRARSLEITDTDLVVELEDGSRHSAPISLFPLLADATAEERAGWEFIEGNRGMHWPLLDEDISVASIVAPERTIPIHDEVVSTHLVANRTRRRRRSA
jgi:hypothetical protein